MYWEISICSARHTIRSLPVSGWASVGIRKAEEFDGHLCRGSYCPEQFPIRPFCISYKLLCWGRTHSGEEAVQPSPLSIKLNCKGCRWDVSDSSSWVNYTITINPVSHKKQLSLVTALFLILYSIHSSQEWRFYVRLQGSPLPCKCEWQHTNNGLFRSSISNILSKTRRKEEGIEKEAFDWIKRRWWLLLSAAISQM